MREIKFRAWRIGRMLESVGIAPVGVEWASLTNSDGYYINANMHNGITTVMQFTGLLDKNGKEIYEGDFVRLDTYPAFGLKDTEGAVQYEGACFWVGTWNLNGRPAEYREVLGNIYENPELLKNEKRHNLTA